MNTPAKPFLWFSPRLKRETLPPRRSLRAALRPALTAILGSAAILVMSQAIAVRMRTERAAARPIVVEPSHYCPEMYPTKSGYWQRCYWER